MFSYQGPRTRDEQWKERKIGIGSAHFSLPSLLEVCQNKVRESVMCVLSFYLKADVFLLDTKKLKISQCLSLPLFGTFCVIDVGISL